MRCTDSEIQQALDQNNGNLELASDFLVKKLREKAFLLQEKAEQREIKREKRFWETQFQGGSQDVSEGRIDKQQQQQRFIKALQRMARQELQQRQIERRNPQAQELRFGTGAHDLQRELGRNGQFVAEMQQIIDMGLDNSYQDIFEALELFDGSVEGAVDFLINQ